MSDAITEVVKKHAKQLVEEDAREKVFLPPTIPAKKLRNAIDCYAEEVSEDQVLALWDNTLFGSAKGGFLITTAAFYFRGTFEDPVCVPFRHLQETRSIEDDEGVVLSNALEAVYRDGTKVPILSDEFSIETLRDLLNEVAKLSQSGHEFEGDKIVIVQDMPDAVKLNYVRTMIAMVRQDGSAIEPDHLSEIQVLMTQLNFSPELRQEIRRSLSDELPPVDAILAEMDQDIPKGSEEALHISLVKDLVRMHRVRDKSEGMVTNSFISEIGNRYATTDEQIEVLNQACIYDEMIMDGKVDDKMIAKNAKNLAAKAAAVGVPIAAVYLSGSVFGLSAAGITSGLATLGLGGILGFSSMVTGIGVAIVIGIAANKTVHWLTSGGKREKVAQRELMIMEIIKLNQQTISNLVKDVEYFGTRLVEMTKSDEINRALMEKLGKELTVFTKAMDVLQQKGIRLKGLLSEEA